ncbi:MAG: hypothetical protein ACXW5U_06860 [Thermoanaerobaculia bacterium]
MIDLVSALQFISIGNRSDFYHAARGLLVHRREDIAGFWRSRGRELASRPASVIGDFVASVPTAREEGAT